MLVLVVLVVLLLVPFPPGSEDNSDAGSETAGSSDSGKAANGEGTNPSASRREVAWTIPAATSEPEANTLATYVVADTFVRATEAALIGYALDSGKESWRIEPPEGFSRVCSVSPTMTDDSIGVVYGSADDECGLVAAIDLAVGEQLWRTKAEPGESLTPGAAVAVTEGRIVGPYPNGLGLFGYSIIGKEVLWDHDLADESCAVGDIAADENAVFYVVECVLAGTNQLVSLDPASGDVNWQSPIENLDPISPAEIVSVSPSVVHVGESRHQGELQVFDESGSLSRTIDAADGGDELEFGPDITNTSTSNHREFPIHIHNDTIIALVWPGLPAPGQKPRDQKVVSVDLNTGERTWTMDLPEGTWLLAPAPGEANPTLVRYPKSAKPRTYTVDPSGKLEAGPTLERPKGGYLSDYVRFVPSDEYLFRVRINDLAYGPAVVAFR